MEFYDAVEKRRTIRDFEDKPIDMEIIKRIHSHPIGKEKVER